MPKVSVVMPVYNGEKYLREAIESIINQTFTDWEFIIVNEFGSNQGATDILTEYAAQDLRIRVIQNSERLGIAESLNVGLRASTGEYIARMDGDDVSGPKRLQKQVEYLDTHQEIDLCGSYIADLSGNKLNWDLETEYAQINTDIIFFSPCVHPTIMFRADMIHKYQVAYKPNYAASEDYDFFEQVCCVGKIVNLPQTLLHYRQHQNNATEKNYSTGISIYKQVIARTLLRLNLKLDKKDLMLLSPHECMKGACGKEILFRLTRLDQILKRILLANKKEKLFPVKQLSHTLYKRMRDAKDSISWACQNVDWKKIDNFYNNSMFRHPWFVETEYQAINIKDPIVTVLLPTYNSEAYIADTLDSILRQTFQNYEVLVINEFGSTDATLDFVDLFADKRIRVIQNQKKLGLAESLNLGIREARGKYIARIDADDTCAPERFAKQVEFLEKNPEYGLCGSWQHHFGADTDMIHKVPVTHEALKAQLIYRCELCHSTLMLRRNSFITNNLYYNPDCAAEDYELWTRSIYQMQFANLPEVLGEYRVGEANITAQKIEALSKESAQICAGLLYNQLEITVPEKHVPFLSSWINEFNHIKNPAKRKKQLAVEKELLCLMWNKNEQIKIYDPNELLYTINKRWRWVTNTWTYGTHLEEVLGLEMLFKQYPMPDSVLKSGLNMIRYYCYRIVKKGVKLLVWPVYRPIKNRLNARFEQLQRQIWDTEGHLKDNQTRIFAELKEWHEAIIRDICEQLFCSFLEIWNSSENRAREALNKELNEVKKQIAQDMEAELSEIEQALSHKIAEYILQVEQRIDQKMDACIREAAQSLAESTDARIWKAEQTITASTDARIWKAEEALTASTDARIWKAEQSLMESTDARIWKAEQSLMESTDARIWKAEFNLRKGNQDTFLKLMPKYRLDRLTIHLTEHCNLNCQCCDNFSPIADESYTSLEKLEKDYIQLKKIGGCSIGKIELSGGEALLHPQVCDFMVLTRQYFQDTEIELLTNGMLLADMSDRFWDTCAQYNIKIVITKYPIKLNVPLIEKKSQKFGVVWRWYEDIELKTSFFAPFNIKGGEDAARNFVNCFHANSCVYFRDGRIYTCSLAANVHHFNKYFGEHLPDTKENSISIYRVGSMKEILEFISRPIPLCQYCDVDGRHFNLPWGISKQKKGEWASNIENEEDKFELLEE